ncbi:MAG: hypothetical protein KFB93_02415 [Simkaniaceae bacterium]|nr:MAG: hypothetical protein KFB93_02415 [Simkaniaceae bacterium]
MHSVVYRPLSPSETQRLFAQTFLSTSHYPEKWEGETSLSLFYIIDSLIGLMRLPYLYKEAIRVYNIVQEEGSPLKPRAETLALIANGIEIVIWCAERKFIILSVRKCNTLQGICYLSRMIIYEEAVCKEGRAILEMWKGKQTEKKEFQQTKVQFISHTAYLGWVALGLISYFNGIAYPHKFMKYLHIVSFTFGLIASGYDEMDPGLRKGLKKFLPQRSIYCF